MEIIELFGFFLAMAMLLFSFVKRILEAKNQALDPEGYQKEQRKKALEEEEAYRQMLQALGLPPPERLEEERKEESPPSFSQEETEQVPTTSRRQVKKDFSFHSAIEDRKTESKIEQRHLVSSVESQFDQDYGKNLVDEDLQGVEKAYSRTRDQDTPLQRIVNGVSKKKEFLLFHEIWGQPRALQPFDERL